MLYILHYSYTPNNAITNRMLGYYRAMDDLGIKAIVVYFMPDSGFNKIQEKFKSIKIEYYWEHNYINNKFLKSISFFFYVRNIKKKLKAGDIVYTYGLNYLTYIGIGIKGVKCYCERTEHPDVVKGYESRLISLNNKKVEQCYKALDGLFVISNPLRDYFVSIGINASKIHIINMIVDASRFIGIEKEETNERYIAYCGTASNNKDGVDELIKAFAIVANKIPDVKLYIIGKTPSITDEAGNLALIERMHLNQRIVFKGIVSAENMPQLLKNAEVLALARPDSLQARCGFPTKLGEYLLTENPVVVTKVGDIPKFLKDSETALLAEQRNKDEFASKLIWALENPTLAKIVGKNGAQIALRNFNSYIETKKMLDVFFADN